MKVNEFFNRVVYIDNNNSLTNARTQLFKRGIKFDVVKADPPNLHVLPPHVTFTRDQLSQLLAFYNVVKKAQTDRLERLLILSDKIKLTDNFLNNFETFTEQIPGKWDLIYFGYDGFIGKSIKQDKLINEVHYASGCFAIAVNFPFFHLLTESAKVPLYSLDEHIKSISLMMDLFIISPPLIVRA